MSAPLSQEADANQALASDPNASAWVSANAGTGKTEVLVRRSLRLLLAGARPECILCLTYTKTAAAEMQNRLLKDLANWATISDEELRETLAALMGHAPDDKDMRRARRLFALSLEARGGLKIHTIHGFCERLLQRFPLESQVTPHFTVLDEQGATLLKRVAFDAVIARAAEDRESALGVALDTIITVTGEEWFRQVVDAVLAKRAELDRMMAHHDGLAHWAAAEGLALKRLFGVDRRYGRGSDRRTRRGAGRRRGQHHAVRARELWQHAGRQEDRGGLARRARQHGRGARHGLAARLLHQ